MSTNITNCPVYVALSATQEVYFIGYTWADVSTCLILRHPAMLRYNAGEIKLFTMAEFSEEIRLPLANISCFGPTSKHLETEYLSFLKARELVKEVPNEDSVEEAA